MKRVLIGLLILLQLGVLGCSGGSSTLTQEDLKKRAIRRPKDVEQPAATGNPGVPANNGNAAGSLATPLATKTLATTNAVPGQTTAKAPALDASVGATIGAGAAPAEATVTVSPTPNSTLDSANLPPVVQPPAQPLSPAEQIDFAANNMTLVNQALRKYVETNLRYPPPAIVANGRPVLSWRVAILPLLGHQALYNQFKLDEPWNGPHNKLLLPRIPSVFQSPERFDENTNYVLATGPTTVFPLPTKGLTPRQIDDGAADTAILLEVDDGAAVPWTKPEDVTINPRDSAKNLGGLRAGSFLVGWADGAVTAVSVSAPPEKIKAMFTVDAGEAFVAAEIQQEISTVGVGTGGVGRNSPTATGGTFTAKAAMTNTQTRSAAANSVRDTQPATLTTADALNAPGPNTPTARRALQERLPIPDDAAQKNSNHLIKTIFGKKYQAANTPQEKRTVVLAMLEEAKKVEHGSADEYALCRAGWKIAIAAGDYQMAEKFRLLLVEAYAVPDELELQAETVRKLSSARLSVAQIDDLMITAQHAIDDAAFADDFNTALEMQEIAESLARRARDAETVRELGRRGTTLKRLAREYQKISSLLGSIDSNNDAQASFQVGRYFCLFKGQWQRGLPLLAAGSDLQMRRLADAELTASINPADQIAVADGWWGLSLDASPLEKEQLQRHAVMIYEQAIPGLEGLAKTKVNMRIDEFYREFGGGESRRTLALRQPAAVNRGSTRGGN